MNLLQDILTYMRRIIKTSSNASTTDFLLIDYVNRFWLMDVDARIQLFDLKTKYQFLTTPGVDQYNMPLYSPQNQPDGGTPYPGTSNAIAMFPVYQGFLNPAYINGVQVSLQTEKENFFRCFPNIVQNIQVAAIGNGGSTYNIQLPISGFFPPNIPNNPPFNCILRGHVDITGIIATGNNVDPPIVPSFLYNSVTGMATIGTANTFPAVYISSIDSTGANVVVADSGQFLTGNVNYGLLMQPGPAPYGNKPLIGGYSVTVNTINYLTGIINVTFPTTIPIGNNINVQCYYFQAGLPREILFYNNCLTFRSPPSNQWLVELDAYLTPAAFLNTGAAIPFGYMAEYIARGAARKILSDTGDWDQFNAYEPLFKEQEMLVWKRSQRQWTNNRTQTIYSQGMNSGGFGGYNNLGGGVF